MPLRHPDPDLEFDIPTSDGKATGRLRTATLADVQRWKETWLPRLLSVRDRSAMWDWRVEIERAKSEGYSCLSLSSQKGFQESTLDGLLAISTSSEQPSRLEPGKELVYIEYIATAPHNRRDFGPPRIRGVSDILLRTAISASRALGLGGRIGLHATPEAEGFYRERLRMHVGQRERQTDGEWLYFEGTPEWADQLTALELK